eukprot:455786-Pelagomonas_calceolata.AAC.6
MQTSATSPEVQDAILEIATILVFFRSSPDAMQFMTALESLTICDYSLAIKAGVHFTLCGGTL